jgi:hypothetical protein
MPLAIASDTPVAANPSMDFPRRFRFEARVVLAMDEPLFCKRLLNWTIKCTNLFSARVGRSRAAGSEKRITPAGNP